MQAGDFNNRQLLFLRGIKKRLKVNAGFSIINHTADIGFQAFSTTLEGLFTETAKNLYNLLLARSARVKVREKRLVVVEGVDREDLLIRWLSELLFLFSTEGFACGQIEILSLSETTLEANLLGEKTSPLKNKRRMEIKAVTYHQVKIDELPKGEWGVQVIFDV